MAKTVGDFIVERLHQWGVRRIYGFPGDGINGVFGALQRAKGKIEFIQVRHEEMAAFMASAHAKFTGELGVCIATSGPGAVASDHRALRRAARSHAGAGDRRPTGALGDRRPLSAGSRPAERCSRTWPAPSSQQAMVPAQVRHLVDRAVRIALGERRVTAHHLAERPAGPAVRGPAARARHAAFGRRLRQAARPCPTRRDLRRAAEVLNAGKKVAILVGAGALHATDEVIAVADKLGAGVAKALLGKAALPDDLPWVTGSIGLLGTKPSYDLMTDATRC